jgi:hypothetical protein
MVVFKVLQEFAGGTCIHRFTFLVSPKSSSRTKIIWTISLVVAMSCASWEMRNSIIGKFGSARAGKFQLGLITSKYVSFLAFLEP